jgi:hypothetical protein
MASTQCPNGLLATHSQSRVHVSLCLENPAIRRVEAGISETWDGSNSNLVVLEDGSVKGRMVSPEANCCYCCTRRIFDQCLCIFYTLDRPRRISCVVSCARFSQTTHEKVEEVYNILAGQTSSLDLWVALAAPLWLCSHKFLDMRYCGHCEKVWRTPFSTARRASDIILREDSDPGGRNDLLSGSGTIQSKARTRQQDGGSELI